MHKALLLFVGQELDYWQYPCSCGYQLSCNIIIPQKYFVEELTRENVEHLPKSITNEYSAKEREVLYMKGGVLFITSRILVVDLLRKQCPVDKVAGLLVFNAHR